MSKTIGNPLSWAAQQLGGAGRHVGSSLDRIGGHEDEVPTAITVNTLTTDDLKQALRLGYEDFAAARADVLMIVVMYPILGVMLISFGLHMALLPLVFPVVAGFALLGPLAAVGLYEMSRIREAGGSPNWGAALRVVGRPRFSALVILGLFHFAIFGLWLMLAWMIWAATLGPDAPASAGSFLTNVFTTAAGWSMLIVGVVVGFFFALAVLACSVVSFPMLLDRNVGVPRALKTSVEVAQKNPRVIALWGMLVAVSLLLGSIPFLIGLVIVMPVLGHATWHLYRKAVSYG